MAEEGVFPNSSHKRASKIPSLPSSQNQHHLSVKIPKISPRVPALNESVKEILEVKEGVTPVNINAANANAANAKNTNNTNGTKQTMLGSINGSGLTSNLSPQVDV